MTEPVSAEALTQITDGPDAGAETLAALARTWGDHRGVTGWLSAIDHKTIARRFMVTTFGFFCWRG